MIPAHSFVDHKITYTPNLANLSRTDEEHMMIRVQDGPDVEITVQGQVNEVRCALNQEAVELTDIPVFSKFETSFYVKNLHKTPAVVHVVSAPPGVEVRPLKSKIGPDEHKQFQCVLFYEEEVAVNDKIVLQQRGGKKLVLPIRFSTKSPKVKILQDHFDFGSLVVQGIPGQLPLTIQNESNVGASLFIDLRTN